MPEETRKLAEALHRPPRIRAACLWGDSLEHRLDFDAAYGFQYFADEVLLWHFARTVCLPVVDGYAILPMPEEHPEWACLELVTELPEAYPGRDDMAHWLANRGAIGYADIAGEDEDGAELASELIEIYLSRADALSWLRQHRPELYADIKAVYSLPPLNRRFFP